MNMSIDNRPTILKKMDGKWVAKGDVQGEPVQYHVRAAPALQNQFTEICMDDVQVPSEYEARIFIGLDSEHKQVIAHWLDNFGAPYSIPHGVGGITEDSIEFIIPYPGSSFKDRFEYHPESDSWNFEITAQQPDGSWKHFAKYIFKRAV